MSSSGLPIGLLLGNEADYLDDEQRSALRKADAEFLFNLPKELRQEALAKGEDEEQSAMAHSVDDDLIISENDISDGSLPEEVTQQGDDEDVDLSEDESEEVVPAETNALDVEYELPILGYGENNERIYCFSKIFSNGGLRYFFDEQKREEEQNERKAKAMAERARRQRQLPPPQAEPINAVEAWLADPETSSESGPDQLSDSDDGHEGNISTIDVGRTHIIESLPDKRHLIDEKHLTKLNLINWEDLIAFNAEDGKRLWEESQADWKSLGLNAEYPMNPHIMKDDWLDNVMISASQPRPPSPRLIWDLNDPHMRFRMQDLTGGINLSNATATILPPKEKRRRILGPVGGEEEVFKDLAYYNVSKDEMYNTKDVRSPVTAKNRSSDALVAVNAGPALTLATVPIQPSDSAALDYHRGISEFYPREHTVHPFMNKNLPENRLEIIFQSVSGRIATVQRLTDDNSTLTIGDLYYKEVQSKAFSEAKSEQPVFLLETPELRSVEPVQTLQSVIDTYQLGKNIVIWVLFESVQLIPDAATELPSTNSKLPVRPPGAFSRKKDLTAADGHILLLEYMEEHPLLHFYPGMGIVLQTWCQAKNGKDQQTCLEELEQKYRGARWKYGQVKMISPEKASPFIGPFQNDEPIFSVESHLIRAPACGYMTRQTDFLLVWSPSGNWSIRSISGAVAVGQQQPLAKIHAPLPNNIKDFEERRLVSYACRKLSRKVRETSIDAKNNVTVISVGELTNMFPILSESVIKSRLKDRCQCIPIRGEDRCFTLKATATHQSESELRQILSPEEACAYDSCRMFKSRMEKIGLKHVDRLTQLTADKWKLALSLLPDRLKEIAQYIQRTMQGAPWNQSEGYHAWKGGRGQVSVVGAGDPSGRGICCSFTKEHLRKTEDSAVPIKPQPVITGTKADLRRLGAEEAISALQGLPVHLHHMIEFEDLRKMDRWEIIRHVRAIATAAVQDGVDLSPNLSKFARNPGSTVQIAVGLKRKVEQVFAKQMKALRNEEVETKVLPIREKPRNKKEDQTPKLGKRRVQRTIVMDDGTERSVTMTMDTYDQVTWGGQDGGRQNEGNKRIIEGRHPTNAFMEEQVVERPLTLKRSVVGNRSRTIAQLGQSKLVFNKNPGTRKKPKRPRTKLTKEEIWGNRYHYFDRKPRSSKRKPKKEIHFLHTVESLEQEELLKALSKPKSKRALKQALIQQQQMRAAGEQMDEQEDCFLTRQASLLSELGLMDSLDLGSFCLDGKAKMPYKTKDGRRMTGRKVLNTKILNKIHTVVMKYPRAKFFKLQVNKHVAPDYNKFVKPTDEIWLDKIASKIRGLKYSTGQAYMDDLYKLRDNAVAYNSINGGQFGGPQIVEFANDLVNSAEEEIAKFKETIVEEEERIRNEDSEKELKRSGSLPTSLRDV